MNPRLILGASVGLLAGLGVVSGTASLVSSQIPAPEYSSTAVRFDQSTFQGRLATMLRMMDPTTLLSTDEQVREAVKKINDYDFNTQELFQGIEIIDQQEEKEEENISSSSSSSSLLSKRRRKLTKEEEAELWRARQLRDSAVHPDTGEIIPRPFRMSGYVPFNGPVCVAMMVSSTTPYLLLWNWVNQSQNALVNYFNRNASSPTSNAVLLQSYATAVSCALLVAFGFSQVIQRRFDAATAKKLLKFVALPASMIASSANAYIMRSPEIEAGVVVYHEDMRTPVAPSEQIRSHVAARKAVMETVYSRILLQIPTFFFPPVFMMLPPVAALAASSAVYNISLNTFVTLVGFGLGLPAAVAVFPQIGTVDVQDLEPELRKIAQEKGLTKVYYNKGL